MKSTFTVVFCLAFFYNLFSQPCLPNGIWFLKQNQIDSFHIKYPGCTRIGGRVAIDRGLENLQADSLTDLTITGNSALSTCSFSGICSWLSAPKGIAKIYYNAPGCANVAEITVDCGGSCPCLPRGNYYFLSQNDVNNFPVHYPECTHLKGDVTIIGDDITNLHGLNGIVEIAGSLMIGYSSYLMPQGTRLANLAGLDTLTHVQGGVKISYNKHLKNLSGIYALKSAEYLTISNNDSLESIAGLSGFVPMIN